MHITWWHLGYIADLVVNYGISNIIVLELPWFITKPANYVACDSFF